MAVVKMYPTHRKKTEPFSNRIYNISIRVFVQVAIKLRTNPRPHPISTSTTSNTLKMELNYGCGVHDGH